jgi:hypothetical protein
MTTFRCRSCEKTLDAEQAPECCGQRMKAADALPVCRTSGAEHSRYDADDEPCDDGRGG